MGSVTVIFLIPVMIVVMLIGTAAGGIKGDNVTQVELPYDPSKGIVWEYDGIDDPLMELDKIEVKGDRQIFTFKGDFMFESLFNEDESEEKDDPYMVMDVIFTDENGNEILYYARVNHDYLSLFYKISFWSPDEYIIFEYTPEEEIPYDGAEWVGYSHSGAAKELGEENGTFSFLVLPDNPYGEETLCELEFTYRKPIDNPNKYINYEKIEMIIQAEPGKCEIKSEDRYYRGPTGLWTDIKPLPTEEQE